MFIKVYHGSDSLPIGQIPDASYRQPVYVTPIKGLAKEFGHTVHTFKVSVDVLLDLRRDDHRKLASKVLNGSTNFLSNYISDKESGLPKAYCRHHLESKQALGSLEKLKVLARKLQFKGVVMIETEWPDSPISFEVYDPSVLIPIDGE